MKFIISILIGISAFSANATTLLPVQLINPTGSTSGQSIVSNGPSSAPAWGNVALSGLSAIAANTVVANASSASAAPSAFAMPSCSGAASALEWTTNSGFNCNVAINAATLNGATFASPPAAGYGSTTPEPVAATTITSGTSGSTSSITVTDTGAAGANIKLSGNGGTTPAKTIRAQGGAFQIVNNAYSSNILQLTDAGSLTVTGSVTPSTTGGIVGTTLADSASAGSVGEYVSSTTSGVSLSNGIITNLTSISLTAGDWDVQGNVIYTPAGTTTTSLTIAAVNTVSATQPAQPLYSQSDTAVSAGVNSTLTAPIQRINVSTTTTVYLVAQANFSVSTMTAGGIIRARRIR